MPSISTAQFPEGSKDHATVSRRRNLGGTGSQLQDADIISDLRMDSQASEGEKQYSMSASGSKLKHHVHFPSAS